MAKKKSYTADDLAVLIQNPNVRKMLDIISHAEGTTKHGYNTNFGGSRLESLDAHPNTRQNFKQTDGKTNVTTAAGRYQFLNSTWNNLAKQYGLKDFSGVSQDMGAVGLIIGRGALDNVLQGDIVGAVKKLGGEWASLPSSTYKQGKRSWEDIERYAGAPLSSVGDALVYTPASVSQAEQELFADNPNPPDIDFGDGDQQAPVLVQAPDPSSVARLSDALVGALGLVPMQTPQTLGQAIGSPNETEANTLVGILGRT